MKNFNICEIFEKIQISQNLKVNMNLFRLKRKMLKIYDSIIHTGKKITLSSLMN